MGQARTTLPALRQEVHTCILRVLPPPAGVRTVWMFGFQRRLVRRCEWDTLWPKPGPLPQTSHTLATGYSWVDTKTSVEPNFGLIRTFGLMRTSGLNPNFGVARERSGQPDQVTRWAAGTANRPGRGLGPAIVGPG